MTDPFAYAADAYRWLVDPYGLFDERAARGEFTFRIDLPVLGDVLMTGEPGLIAEILQHRDLDGGKGAAVLGAILGRRSLIMLEGEAHAARHRMLAPLFRGEALADHDELTVRLTRETLGALPVGRTFSIYDSLRTIGLRAMVVAMFGDDAPTAEAEAKVRRFLGSFHNPLILFCPALRVDAGRWSPWGRAVRNRRELCEFIRVRIHAARERSSGRTILERLSAGSLDEETLTEEVLSLLLFGHDTAAATMAWAFAHVYGARDAVERIRAEYDDDPEAMPYLGACVRESMRLCPVVVHLSRTATADVRLGGHVVRRGRKVIPCTYLAQHNPSVFPEPYAFRPERFLDGRRYDHAFFPFGFGGRTCVGRPFAMRQMLLVLAAAVRWADLELAPGYVARPARQLVLIAPRGGCRMRRRG